MTTGILNAADQLYNSPGPEYFPGQTVAGLNPMQTGGIDASIGAANQMAGYVPTMMNAAGGAAGNLTNWVTGGGAGIDPRFMDMMSPEEINAIQGNFQVNPFIEGQADAFGQAARRNIQQNIIPTTNMNAIMAGQMGSSRHGIAQGLATANVGQGLNETLAHLYGNAWQNAAANQLTSRGQTLGALGQERARGTNAALGNARNQTAAYGLLPAMMGAYGNLAQTASGLSQQPASAMLMGGGMLQGNAQQQLNAEQDRWNFYQNRPWEQLGRYSGVVQGTGIPQGHQPQLTNPYASAAYGVQTGLNAWDMMGGSGGSAPNPFGFTANPVSPFHNPANFPG